VTVRDVTRAAGHSLPDERTAPVTASACQNCGAEVHGESWPRTVAKSAFVLPTYMACLFLVSFGMLGYALMRM
jgi:hypothetical protein